MSDAVVRRSYYCGRIEALDDVLRDIEQLEREAVISD
jgi:hypothetical protein